MNLIFSILALLIVIGFIAFIGLQLVDYPTHLLTLIPALLITYVPLLIAIEALLFAVKYLIEIKKPKGLEIHIVNIARIVAMVAFFVIYTLTFHASKTVLIFEEYIMAAYICSGVIVILGLAEIVIAIINAKKLKK